MKWIFDVDGTLTPSRGKMDPEFREYFIWFAKTHRCYLATGSDYPKTLEQVGEDVLNAVQASFNCSGNSVWIKGKEVHRLDWTLDPLHRKFFESKLDESKFFIKTGNHIEERPGMINFSIVGRNANLEERFHYRQWDEHKKERKTIAKEFEQFFGTQVVCQVAGETGIDVFPFGYDKSQIAAHIKGSVVFFGDKMTPGGNDYTLAKEILKRNGSRAIEVTDWKDTWKRMKIV
jgi:phosphomannomutase